jgi:hypothetical protein
MVSAVNLFSSLADTPTALGTVTVDVTATDAVGASSLAAYTLRIVSVALVPDFLSPGLTMLVVATPASDLKGTIITPVDAAGDLSVYLNGSTTAAGIALTSGGTALAALPTGHILVYGNNSGSADAIHLKAGTNAIAVPAFLFGGTSNEILDHAGYAQQPARCQEPSAGLRADVDLVRDLSGKTSAALSWPGRQIPPRPRRPRRPRLPPFH